VFSYLHFIRRNPRFLAFGFVLTFFSSFGQTSFIGLFGPQLREEFGLDNSGFGLILRRRNPRQRLLADLGRPLDRSPRPCQGLLVHTAVTAMARYFLEGRGKAVSLASAGNTVGQGLFPPLAVAAAALWGWRPVWLAIAIGGAVVLLPLALHLLRGHSGRHAALLATLDKDSSRAGSAAPPPAWTRAAVLRDPVFYLVAPALLAAPFITTGFFFHVGALAEAKAWDLGWLSGLYPIYAAVTVAAALAAGGLIDRGGAVRLLPRFLWPLAAGLALLAASNHWLAAAGYLALMGLSAGANFTLNGAIWAELYGVGHIGAIRALATALMIFATAASPAVFGALLDAGCIGWIVVASPLAARAGQVRRRQASALG
jgi:MFS family permease